MLDGCTDSSFPLLTAASNEYKTSFFQNELPLKKCQEMIDTLNLFTTSQVAELAAKGCLRFDGMTVI